MLIGKFSTLDVIFVISCGLAAFLLQDYAKLKAYHLYETETAAQILEECIDLLPESELQSDIVQKTVFR